MRLSLAIASLLATFSLAQMRALAAPPLAPSATSLPASPTKEHPARAPNVTAAVLAGLATSLLPFSLGAVIASSGTENPEKNTGLLIAGAGLSLAPLVSHAVLREWKRGLVFSAVPMASEIAMTALLRAKPDAVFGGTKLSRSTYAALMSLDVFGAALGIVDVMMADERANTRALVFVPTVSGTHVGFTLGGSL